MSCLPLPPPASPSIFPSADQENTAALIPATHNTGGSLPDLSTIHFPSPLPTPLDPEEPPFPALTSSGSTGSLAHLGVGGAGQGKAPMLSPLAACTAVRSSWVCSQQWHTYPQKSACGTRAVPGSSRLQGMGGSQEGALVALTWFACDHPAWPSQVHFKKQFYVYGYFARMPDCALLVHSTC